MSWHLSNHLTIFLLPWITKRRRNKGVLFLELILIIVRLLIIILYGNIIFLIKFHISINGLWRLKCILINRINLRKIIYYLFYILIVNNWLGSWQYYICLIHLFLYFCNLNLFRWFRRFRLLLDRLFNTLEFFHLCNGYCPITINPFSLNLMLIFGIHDLKYWVYSWVGDKTKSSWLLGSFIL